MTARDMVANSAAWEQFQSYFKGWRDGAAGRPKHFERSEHGYDKIRIPYNDGYDAGHKASNDAASAAAEKFGYEISKGILR